MFYCVFLLKKGCRAQAEGSKEKTPFGASKHRKSPPAPLPQTMGACCLPPPPNDGFAHGLGPT